MSRRKKENKRKVRKTKDKRLKQRARHLLGNLTSIEVAGQIFGSIEENDRVTPVDSINADFAKKLTRRLHLDPLLWLLEKGIFSTTLAKNLEQVAAILRAQSPGSTCRRGLNVMLNRMTRLKRQMKLLNGMMRLKMRQMKQLNRI